MALGRLGRLLGEPRYMTAAERCLTRGAGALQDSPLAHATLLRALVDRIHPPPQLIISGTDPDRGAAMKQWVERHHALDCYLVGPEVEDLPGMLCQFRTDQPVTAWLCRDMQCMPPVHSVDDLQRVLVADRL